MPAEIDIGDDYSIDESGSDFILRHDPSGSEIRFDSADELFEYASQVRFTEALTDSNGKTIYDVSTGTVGDGTTSADHESVSTAQLDNAHFAEVGKLQNTLSKLGSGFEPDFLILSGDYTGEGTLEPPENTRIISFGARIRPESENVAVDLSAGKISLAGPLLASLNRAPTPDACVVVDSSKTGDDIRLAQFNHIDSVGRINCIGPSGDGLKLITSPGNNIALGNSFDIAANNLDNHVVLDTNGGFINGGQINLHSRNYANRSVLHKSSNNNGAPAGINIKGQIQVENTDHAIESEIDFADLPTGAQRSVTFSGHIYDPLNANSNAVTGDALRINVNNQTPTSSYDFGKGSVINGTAREASAGTPTRQGQITAGDFVKDTTNGDLYRYNPDGSFYGPL